MREFLLVAGLFLTSCGALTIEHVVTSEPEQIDQVAPSLKSETIDNQYIVKFKENNFSRSYYAPAGAKVTERIEGLGFAVVKHLGSPNDLLTDDVMYIEQDMTAYVTGTQTEFVKWHLDRIDSRRGYDNIYHYDYTGKGAHIFILDDGIDKNHQEFKGRIGESYSFVGGTPFDCASHGTGVASVAAGDFLGAAKDATIHSMRVMGCNGKGSYSAIIKGIDKVIELGLPKSVINMSLGGSVSRSLNEAVRKAHEAGIVVVVSAGNSYDDSCRFSPASAPEAITVGATDRNDKRSSFSNYGACTDIFAAGSSVLVAREGTELGTKVVSGTSFSSPITAGVAALILEEMPDASPSEVADVMMARSTKDAIISVGTGSPNRLVYSLTDDF